MNHDQAITWDPLPDLVPVRMLNAYAFCPRMAYLEWVQGEFAPSADTVEGNYQHRNVDVAPEADSRETDGPTNLTAVSLSAPVLGLITVMDLVEFDGSTAIPVDYKKGSRGHTESGVYEAEQIQLCAQGLILEENGYTVDHGVAYFVEEKTRVSVPFDDRLRARTLEVLGNLKAAAESGVIPKPLHDSPKCTGCSLVGICLPDEVEFLNRDPNAPPDEDADEHESPRMILPTADDAMPVYVETQGLYIGKRYGNLRVTGSGETLKEIPLHQISSLSIFGSIQISTQALQSLSFGNVPVCFFSSGGWFYGILQGLGHKNVELRVAQAKAFNDPQRRLTIARQLVADKIHNCRVLIRRNRFQDEATDSILRTLKGFISSAETADAVPSLLGIEGSAAREYFQNFSGMLKPKTPDAATFDMTNRNRRPPKDPINAMLSLAYSLLMKTWMVTLAAVGFDPYLGMYHKLRYGRPSLALDLMEPFRPLIADSAVITAVNNGIVQPNDFICRAGAVAMTSKGRKAFIEAFERRLGQPVTHPVFNYVVTYRQVFEVQARLLARYFLGEIAEPPSFRTR